MLANIVACFIYFIILSLYSLILIFLNKNRTQRETTINEYRGSLPAWSWLYISPDLGNSMFNLNLIKNEPDAERVDNKELSCISRSVNPFKTAMVDFVKKEKMEEDNGLNLTTNWSTFTSESPTERTAKIKVEENTIMKRNRKRMRGTQRFKK